MIHICVQKTVLNDHTFYQVDGEHNLYDLVDEYLGYTGDQALVAVGTQKIDPSEFKNIIIESGDLVYMSVAPREASTWLYVATLLVSLWAGYQASRISVPDSTTQDERLQMIQGLRNEVRKYQAIPMVIGEHRVTPDFAAMPYTEISGGKQYYNILFNGGYAPQETSDFRIGDTSIDDYEEVEVVHYNGYNGTSWSNVSRRWPSDVVQETVEVEVDKETSYAESTPITRTLPVEATSANLDFSFPQGLVHFTDEGRKMDTMVWIQADYTPQNSNQTYRPVRLRHLHPTGSRVVCTGDIVYYSPEDKYYLIGQHQGRGTLGGVKSGDGFITIKEGQVPSIPGKIDVTWLIPFSVVRSSEGIIHLNITPMLELSTPPIELTLAGYTVKKSTREPFYESIRLPELDRERVYDVSVRVLEADGINPEDARETLNSVVWNTLTGFRPTNSQGFLELMGAESNDSPYRPVVTYVRIKATNQLNGMLDKFNYLAKTVVPSDWNADWSTVNNPNGTANNAWAVLPASQLAPTDNPAMLYRAMLQGPWNAKALPNDRINLDALTDWRDLCITEGYKTSAFKRETDTLQNELNKIAFTGRGEYALIDGKYTVVTKTPRPFAVQLFTNKNSWGFTASREFEEDTDGLKFQFFNKDFDYEQDEGRFVNPEKEEEDLRDLFTTVEIPYVSDSELATRHARFLYWSNKLQREVYVFNTDIENLRCTRGDRIKIQNDVIEVGLGSGRITDIGSTSFRIDESVGLEVGVEYTFTLRSSSDNNIVTSFTATHVGDSEFESPHGVAISVGDLVSYGTGGIETLDCTVVSIDYADQNYEAQITCVNYAPEIYDIDEGPVPPYTTNITPKVEYRTPAAPTILVPEDPAEFSDGFARIRIKANPRQDSPIQSYTLEAVKTSISAEDLDGDVQTDDNWEVVGVTTASQGYVDIEIDVDNYWKFRARALGQNNLFSPYSEVVSLFVPTGPAEDVQSITLQELVDTPRTPAADLSTVVVRVVPPDDNKWGGAIIQYKSVNEFDWFNAGRFSLEDTRVEFTVRSDGTEYEVRAISISKSEVISESDVRQSITVYDVKNDPEKEEIAIPSVRGLELYNQGNDSIFEGRDANFAWLETSFNEWTPFANESGRGIDYGGLDQYFRDYEVQIWANNHMVHLDHVNEPHFSYTYEKNAEDYERMEGEPGAYREFQIRVFARGRNNQVSERPAKLNVSNPPPGALQQLSVQAGFNVIDISYRRPTDRDFAGVRVWVETSSDFNPENTEPKAIVSDNTVTLSRLDQGTTYYVVLQPFDEFGFFGAPYTSEIAVTTKTGTDLTGLSGWAYRIDPVDREFIESNLDGSAIPSEKIANLTVAKLTGGVINATETITSEGLIRAVDSVENPEVQVGIGPISVDNTAYLMWAITGEDNLKFGITENGDAFFDGSGVFRGQLILADGYTVTAEDDIRGLDGSDGLDGAGIYSVQVSSFTTWGSISSIFQSQYGRAPVDGDTVSQVNSSGQLLNESGNTPAVRTFDGSSWVAPRQYIAGNLIATGTISGDRFVAGTEITAPLVTLNTEDGGAVRAGKANYSSTTSGFWLGVDGSVPKLNLGDIDNYVQYDGERVQIKTDKFSVDDEGNAVFSGDLQAAGGTFNGDLQAAGGSFSGDLQAAGGTFSGNLQAVGGTIKGASFETSNFVNNVSGVRITSNGAVQINGVGSGSSRLSITNEKITVYDNNNRIRVELGLL